MTTERPFHKESPRLQPCNWAIEFRSRFVVLPSIPGCPNSADCVPWIHSRFGVVSSSMASRGHFDCLLCADISQDENRLLYWVGIKRSLSRWPCHGTPSLPPPISLSAIDKQQITFLTLAIWLSLNIDCTRSASPVLFVYLSVNLFGLLFVFLLPLCLSACLSVYVSVCLSIHLSLCANIYLFSHLHAGVNLGMLAWMYVCMCVCVCVCGCLSVCLSVLVSRDYPFAMFCALHNMTH